MNFLGVIMRLISSLFLFQPPPAMTQAILVGNLTQQGRSGLQPLKHSPPGIRTTPRRIFNENETRAGQSPALAHFLLVLFFMFLTRAKAIWAGTRAVKTGLSGWGLPDSSCLERRKLPLSQPRCFFNYQSAPCPYPKDSQLNLFTISG